MEVNICFKNARFLDALIPMWPLHWILQHLTGIYTSRVAKDSQGGWALGKVGGLTCGGELAMGGGGFVAKVII